MGSSLSRRLQRALPEHIRGWLRRLAEHLLIPALACVIPWPLYYRLLYCLAGSERLLLHACQQAIAGHQAVLGTQPDKEWLRRFRLNLLIDRADAFLTVTRSSRWLDHHVAVSGQWPKGPFIGITFHYGGGMWSIPHMARQGLRAAFLSIRFDIASFGYQRLLYYLARFRMWTVERQGRATTIYTGGSMAKIREALSEGTCVIGLIDVPPNQAEKGRYPVQLFGRPASLPIGLLQLAATEGVAIATFVMTVDWHTGHRRLEIFSLQNTTPEKQLAEIATLLDKEILRQPEAWHLWLCATSFLRTTSLD